jgi:hypothetical protein
LVNVIKSVHMEISWITFGLKCCSRGICLCAYCFVIKYKLISRLFLILLHLYNNLYLLLFYFCSFHLNWICWICCWNWFLFTVFHTQIYPLHLWVYLWRNEHVCQNVCVVSLLISMKPI